MSKELYEATIEYTKDYNGESWIATISDEKYIDMDTFERVIADLEAKLADTEFRYENLHNLYYKDTEELKQQLAESENKLNRYPYKNEVIEEQYEDLKDAITFLMLNNIKDQEQLNYSIDVLCEKHKARIRDIENSICIIEKLKHQLVEKDNQDEISFALEQLEKVKNRIESKVKNIEKRLDDLNIKIVCESTSRELITYEETVKIINNQIKQLKEMR